MLVLIYGEIYYGRGWQKNGRVKYVKPKDVTSEIQREIVDSLNKIILERSPASTMESVSDRVKQLEGVVRVNGQNTESVRSVLIQLQGRVNHQSINLPETRDQMAHCTGSTDQGSPRSNATSREREVARKGIERREKQIWKLIIDFISQEQVDIALLKKCKRLSLT